MEITYRVDGKEFRTDCSNDCIRIEDEMRGGTRKTVVTARVDMELRNAEILMPWKFNLTDMFMTNGYQSWTETREFMAGEYLTNLAKRPKLLNDKFHYRAYGSQAFWDMPAGVYQGFDFSYITGKNPIFIGSHNFKNAYLMIRFEPNAERIRLVSDCEGRELKEGESFTLFDFDIAEDGEKYFSAFEPVSRQKLAGYTTWYNHYQDINEEKIEKAILWADSRFQVFQIDDGYECFVGDWLDVDRGKFPRGLEPIVQDIHNKPMLAGIWIAPFVAEEESKLVSKHPDWIAKDKKGENIYAGGNWSGCYALDLNHPEVVEYIRKVLTHYAEMQFDFFKLDFLYAANLKRLKGKTRCETSEFAYSLLRETLGKKTILGCGATLANACGRFDFCRVGPDVSLIFDDAPHRRLTHPERISTKVTLMNTIFRSPLNKRMFLNDPDVFMLRSEKLLMPFYQRSALTTINALFGSLLMTPDDLSKYDSKKHAVLNQALDLFFDAKVLSYKREDMLVEIHYEFKGQEKTVFYDMQMGALRDRKRAGPLRKEEDETVL
ncbi:MAG: alpha-galactosidase [Clostridiales bacterium]|nr:alpha-galactosidase [Clostridiales bacterium]